MVDIIRLLVGAILMLGFDVSERTISRWMKRAPKDPEPCIPCSIPDHSLFRFGQESWFFMLTSDQLGVYLKTFLLKS